MVLARFLPKDEHFFSHFKDAADNAAESARVLSEIVDSGVDTERKVRRLRDLEHQGDEISHRIFDALNSTFVTPLDREDIRGLTTSIDDFVDGVEEAGKRIWLYRLGAPSQTAKMLARILREQGAVIAQAMQLLDRTRANSEKIRESAQELHRLENEADEALTTSLTALYEGVTEVPALIQALRWGELYQLLEDATDRGEDIADTLQGILLKYA
jgi:predicted phosphate transport protein (TIGR00153 family)